MFLKVMEIFKFTYSSEENFKFSEGQMERAFEQLRWIERWVKANLKFSLEKLLG